jgi:hypothetical protein
MADACRRRLDTILVWEIDQFGRSLKHLVNASLTPISPADHGVPIAKDFPERLTEVPTHSHFVTSRQSKPCISTQNWRYSNDAVKPNDGRTMHSSKGSGIKSASEFIDRCSDQIGFIPNVQPCIVSGRFYPVNLFAPDKRHAISCLNSESAKE